MITLSGPREGRDRNRNGRASALYLCDRDPGVPAASVRISHSGAPASFVRERPSVSIKLIQIKQHTLGAK